MKLSLDSMTWKEKKERKKERKNNEIIFGFNDMERKKERKYNEIIFGFNDIERKKKRKKERKTMKLSLDSKT